MNITLSGMVTEDKNHDTLFSGSRIEQPAQRVKQVALPLAATELYLGFVTFLLFGVLLLNRYYNDCNTFPIYCS